MNLLTRLTIPQRIAVLITTAIAVLAAIIVLNVSTLSRLQTLQDIGAERAANAERVSELSGMGPKLYVVVADAEIKFSFAAVEKEWAAVRDETRGDLQAALKIADTEAERGQVAVIQTSFENVAKIFESQMLPALKVKAQMTPEVQRLDDAIDTEIEHMQAAADGMLATLVAEAKRGDEDFDRTSQTSRSWLLVISLVGLVVILAAAKLMARDISRAMRTAVADLKTGAQQVAAASSQVAGSAQQLSRGSTDQAASLEETSASMEEMSSMTRRNAENANRAAARVADAERAVASANGVLKELVASMADIRDSSAQVTKIVKTIDEIAFQTNILALNAAVEAARAGEAGMGFAVVADEVRSLAQRSAQAAKDTARLIEASSTNAENGVAKVDGVVSAMTSITENSAVVRQLIDEVSSASQQQTQGIDQVTHAIGQMEKVTQSTAATAEEGAAASEELSAQAEQSMVVVGRLEQLVGGAAAPAVSSSTKRRDRIARTSHAPTSAAKVVPMRPAVKPAVKPTAEELLPLDDTGTYGSF